MTIGRPEATKAAAELCMVSKRRNKAWYRLARLGADFTPELVEDLARAELIQIFTSRPASISLEKGRKIGAKTLSS